MNLKSQIHRISCFPYRHFERSEKSSSHSALSCFLRRSIPIFRITHRTLYRCARKIKGFARDDDTGIALSKHIRCTLHEINPSPHTVISSAARNLPCTPLLLAPFTEGFPFPAITHTALYQCARKIPRLRSGWRCRSGVFPTYPLYATWNKPIPPYRHFERSEKSSLHSTFSCSFRKRFPIFRCRTYGAIPACQKDPSASLGMTIQK